jgi:hypothetical protein
MAPSDLHLDLQAPPGPALAEAADDVRRLPELAGSVEERRWEASWTAWAQHRAPGEGGPAKTPARTPARAARWAGHRRPRRWRVLD